MKKSATPCNHDDFYFVSGLYHLFVVLCLKLQENSARKGTCVIVDCFDHAHLYYERVLKSEIFEELFFFPSSILTSYNKYTRRFIRLNYMWQKRKLCFFNKRYENIYFAGHYQAMFSFAQFQKKYYDTQILLFDDGLGRRIVYEKIPTLSKGIGTRILNPEPHSIRQIAEKVLLFSPELAPVHLNMPVIQQRKPSESIKPTLNHIFGHDNSKDEFANLDLLYLECGFGGIPYLKQYEEKEYALIDWIFNTFPEMNASIKVHPGGRATLKHPYFENNSLLESLFNNSRFANDGLIVTTISAGAFNPKFIFDKEPYILLVYKLVCDDNFSEILFGCDSQTLDNNILKSFSYRDPDRLCIPNSYKEMEMFITKYMTDKQR